VVQFDNTERYRQYMGVAYFGAQLPESPWGRIWTFRSSMDDGVYRAVALTEDGARRVIEAEHPKALYELVSVSEPLAEEEYQRAAEVQS
jgi:hypothetical protein